MKKTIVAALQSLVAATALHASADPGSPWLKYEWSGGFSSYSRAFVAVHEGGETTVEIAKQKCDPFAYTTTLSKEEMASLRTLISAAEFFAQPEKDEHFATDTGISTIFIRLGKHSRELTFRYRPSLEPLTSFLWRLPIQADAIEQLATGKAYDTKTAVSPLLSGSKALQPQAFIQPLKQFVRETREPQQLEYGLEALSWITTPEEWTGLLSLVKRDMEKHERGVFMQVVTSHPFYGNIPKPHLEALCPFLLSFLIENWDCRDNLSDEEKHALSRSFYIIGSNHYSPALPFLLRLFDSHDELHTTGELLPIMKMGTKSLPPLVERLGSDTISKRLKAIELLEMAFRAHTKSKWSDPIDDYEYSWMMKMYPQAVRSKLTELAEDDPSDEVRTSARKALESIEKEIRKWDSNTTN